MLVACKRLNRGLINKDQRKDARRRTRSPRLYGYAGYIAGPRRTSMAGIAGSLRRDTPAGYIFMITGQKEGDGNISDP
jgi:hypothetical protein